MVISRGVQRITVLVLFLIVLFGLENVLNNTNNIIRANNENMKNFHFIKNELNYLDNSELGVGGEMMQAFLVAFDAFEKESSIEKSKKHIKNYNIGLTLNEGSYQVRFVPKRLPEEKLIYGGSTSLGTAITFIIDEKTFLIKEIKFYK